MGIRRVILRIEGSSNEPKNILVETSFSTEDIENAVGILEYKMLEIDTELTENMLISELEKRGYIKILSPMPEIIDIEIY